MSIKPTDLIQWAMNATAETRQGGSNKIEPTQELKNNGSLDGQLSLNHFNWMMNVAGNYTTFINEMVAVSNGAGTNLTKDGHFSFIVAANKTNLAQYVTGIAFKSGIGAGSIQTLQSATLSFGTPEVDGDVPIIGANSSDIFSFSLNYKL